MHCHVSYISFSLFHVTFPSITLNNYIQLLLLLSGTTKPSGSPKNIYVNQKMLEALPNFKMYYWAAHLSILTWWRKGPPFSSYSCPAWLCIEYLLCNKTSLLALLYSPTKVRKSHYSNSFVINGTMRTWEQIKLHNKSPSVHTDTPICENHAFIPGLNDIAFSAWKQKGIKNINDLYIGGHFAIDIMTVLSCFNLCHVFTPAYITF